MAAIIIAGLARSGKDTAAKYISKKYKYSPYTFSSVLDSMLRDRGETPTKKKMIELGDALRGQLGMDALAQMLDKRIKETDNIILAGPRSIEEVEYFRKKYPNLKIVKLVSDKSARFARKSKIDPHDKKEFFERDERDLKAKGMQKVLDAAQYEILNNSTKKVLQQQLDVLMEKIRENRI